MANTDIHALLDALLAKADDASDFHAEVAGYIEDLGEGDLDAGDIAYIREVAKRLGVSAGESAAPTAATPAATPAEPTDRFDRAKTAFARLFHPDTLDTDDPDHALRSEIFETYWAELERIERDD